MATLALVGIGLGLGDLSPAARKVVTESDQVFCETYTSLVPGLGPETLQDALGRKVTMVNRSDIEQGSTITDSLSEGDVALLVPGDPMISTTHISLRVEVAKSGHRSTIIHSSSILSAAIGESCLQATRFGRMATIAFRPSEQPYDVLAENLSRGLHTLFLLDVDHEGGRFMSIRQALESLLTTGKRRGGGLVIESTTAIGLARVSHDDQIAFAGPVHRLLDYDFGGPPHSLIIPGELHFVESEALQLLLGLSPG